MPKIDKKIIDTILSRARIEEVVGDFIQLRKTGVRYTAICPFHEDRHDGNFIVYPKENCYRCFTCDAKGGPVQFLMEHAKMTFPDAIRWLGKKYNIDVDDIPSDYKLPPLPPPPPPLPMLCLPMAMVTNRERTDADTLCQWLRSLPWDGCQRKRCEEVLKEYHVGHAKNNMTIFWQIDDQNRVRTGKMMKYKTDGHRDKETKYNFDWIHSLLSRKHYESDPWPYPHIFNPEEQECKPTLFGLHLLDKYPKAAVHIVESEKTALIMAIAYGNTAFQVWMACGGAENLSIEKLAPITKQKRRIILYPDRDAIDKWRAKAANLRYDRTTINVQAVKDWWKPEDGEKADIADVIIRMLTTNTKPPAVTIGDMMKQNPAVKTLVDNLKLEEDKDNGTEE